MCQVIEGCVVQIILNVIYTVKVVNLLSNFLIKSPSITNTNNSLFFFHYKFNVKQ